MRSRTSDRASPRRTRRGTVDRRLAILVVVGLVLGCSPPERPVTSEWSDPVEGLKLQITSDATFRRTGQGLAMLEVTCTIRNAGKAAADVTNLARLFLVNDQGKRTRCLREEDVADMVAARPRIAPGGATAWEQDGQVEVDAGEYELFAVWDGNKELKSPSVKITVALNAAPGMATPAGFTR